MGFVLKAVEWLGTTSVDIRDQRSAIRNELGQQLFRVQLGLMPNNYKPVSAVGAGTYEIRVQDADGIARLMYVAKFRDTIYVLHVFTKKSQRISKTDIELARRRYREARDG